MGKIIGLQCIICGQYYSSDAGILTCTKCGREGILDVKYDYTSAARFISREVLASNKELSHWRYLDLMPLEPGDPLSPLRVGWSPLYASPRLAQVLDIKSANIKDDGQNPTNSLKDRASSVGVSLAKKTGATSITCASTGNAASSLAGNAAAIGLKAYIFVPERIPEGKLAQLLVFGAEVFVVQGSYEDAFELSMKAAADFGWYNRNSGINPYLVEGKKTVAFEICEQLNWRVPEWVAMSVGDGCSIAALWKGFKEFRQLGLIETLPRLLGVQAAGAAPIFQAWQTGKEELAAVIPQTLADSIAVGTPRSWRKALRAVIESDGVFITVSDEDILAGMRLLGKECGIFAEPAAAAAVAGVMAGRREGILTPASEIVIVITGNGLKDTASAIKATAGKAHFIKPVFNEVLLRVKN